MFKKILHVLNRVRKVIFSPIPLLFLIIVISVGAGFLFIQYRKGQEQIKKLSNVQTQEETKTLVASVGKLIELPAGEQPTIATVTDRDKLNDQPFFQRSQNGDKVLIYTTDKRVILYRPSTNKVIDITSVNADAAGTPLPTSADASAATPKPTQVRVALYNGTLTPGLTNKASDRIKADFPQTTVTIKGTAQRSTYTADQVIDLTGTNGPLATQIASIIGGKVTPMPVDEVKPDADILIIVAN